MLLIFGLWCDRTVLKYCFHKHMCFGFVYFFICMLILYYVWSTLFRTHFNFSLRKYYSLLKFCTCLLFWSHWFTNQLTCVKGSNDVVICTRSLNIWTFHIKTLDLLDPLYYFIRLCYDFSKIKHTSYFPLVLDVPESVFVSYCFVSKILFITRCCSCRQ